MHNHHPSAAGVRILHADAAFDGARSLHDAALVMRGDVVVEFGPATALIPRHRGASIERVAGVIAPGLVNAHTHMELSALRGRLPRGAGFVSWVNALMFARAQVSEAETSAAVAVAVTELVQGGTVALGEVSNSLCSVPALARASLDVRVFHEYFGLDAQAAPDQFVQMAKMAASYTYSERMQYSRVPHALHTTHPSAVRELLAAARASGARSSVHLAEHPHERALLDTGVGAMADWLRVRTGQVGALPTTCGKGPIERAAELGLLAPDVLLVHLADATDAELERVASTGARVVLCPRSNAFLAGPQVRAMQLAALGVAVALGTDSLASCDSLSVADEAAFAWSTWPELGAEYWLTAATANGAAALGYTHLGSFATGKRPGVIWVSGGPVSTSAAEFLLHHARDVRRLELPENPR